MGVLWPPRYFLDKTTEPPSSPFQADGEENGHEEKNETEGNKEDKTEDEHGKSESRLVLVGK